MAPPNTTKSFSKTFGRSDTVGYQEGESRFLRNTYNYMFFGLLFTALTAYIVTSMNGSMEALFGMVDIVKDGKTVTTYTISWVFWSAVIAEFVLVVAISWFGLVSSVGGGTAFALFAIFSVLNGLTIAPLLHAYTTASAVQVFAITAATFGGASLFGVVTKRDLTGMSHYVTMALWGLLVALVVGVFMRSTMYDMVVSCIAVLLFVGITAFDVQNLRTMYRERAANSSDGLAVYGALTLYLDFLNLFVHLLRLFGIKVND